MSRSQPSRKPKKQRRFRNLSDPHILSELALRLQEGIYITTMDGEIVDANPAFLEMFGVESLQDLKGYSAGDFVRPEVRAREMAQLERDGSVRDIEFQLTRRDGKEPRREAAASPRERWHRPPGALEGRRRDFFGDLARPGSAVGECVDATDVAPVQHGEGVG